MRITTKRLVLAIAATMLVASGSGQASGGNITYSLVNDPVDQNGFNLSGTIVTDGTIGALAPSDFVSWQYTITWAGVPFTNEGSRPYTPSYTGVTATATAIQVSGARFLNTYDPAGFPDYVGWDAIDGIYQATGTTNGGIGVELWSASPPIGFPSIPWTVATASVPEPSSAVLAALGAVGGLAYGYGARHRRQAAAAGRWAPQCAE